MNRFTKIIIISALCIGPVVASAQSTPTNTQVQSMIEQIKALQAQIQALKDAQAKVTTAQTNISNTLSMMRSLKQGMSGDDVKALQTILASDPTIYQGGVTGFFGNMTAEGVKKFQKKHGFESVGFVGPKTLKKLNEEIERLGLSKEDDEDSRGAWMMFGSTTPATSTPMMRREGKLCVRVAPGHLIAPGWLKKEHGDDDEEDRPFVPECQRLPKGIEDKLDGWWPGTTTTPPIQPTDTQAPVISSVIASSTGSGAIIAWTTNEPSTSKVWFGTTTPVNLTLNPVSNGTMVTMHSIPLSGLATSTVYYYIVGLDDTAGNKATSTQNSFTTLAQ